MQTLYQKLVKHSQKKTNAGTVFESMACEHLTKQGLKLQARNYRSRFGEIDLIMKDKNTIVFVEVRKRRSLTFGHPIETVDYHKQQKIIKTAYAYLQTSRLYETVPCRFDIVGVTLHAGKYHLVWCQHAFTEEG